MHGIKFGTDGWRGVIARDFTFGNLELVVRAVAAYLRSEGFTDRGAVVAYDNRFLADRFAAAAAEELQRWGITVYIAGEAVPTPAAAFAIRRLGAGGAVVLTASHNPPEYCGIKFIPEYAGPALPDVTERIEGLLAEGPAPPCGLSAPRVELRPMEDYFTHLFALVDGAAIRHAGLKIVVDPMYGAGIGYLDGILERSGVTVSTIHDRRDPLFGGGLPDPSEARLGELRDAVLKSGAHLGLALDGDADRLGVIDADGTYVSPNQMLAVTCYHLLEARGWRGPVARTVATSHSVDRIAAAYGVEVFETPVGFKYIGQCLRNLGCICGGEESGGLSIRGHVPEKDGILAGILAAEVVAVHGKPLTAVLDEISQRFGYTAGVRRDYRTTPEQKERVIGVLNSFRPLAIAGQAVKNRNDVDGVKLELSSGAWVLIRASGTEPVFRVYSEAATREETMALQEAVREELKL